MSRLLTTPTIKTEQVHFCTFCVLQIEFLHATEKLHSPTPWGKVPSPSLGKETPVCVYSR